VDVNLQKRRGRRVGPFSGALPCQTVDRSDQDTKGGVRRHGDGGKITPAKGDLVKGKGEEKIKKRRRGFKTMGEWV